MDNKKVGYTLSFMTKGTAKSWAAIHTQNTLDASSFGAFPDFIKDVQTTFQSTNSTAKATTWLTNTHVHNNDYLPKYMGEFKLKVVEAKLDSTTHAATIIHYLWAGIPVWLSDWIYGMEVISTTPKGWYEKINQFLSQWHFAASVAKQHSSRTPIAFHTPTPTRSTPSKDPNAMDVDTKEQPMKLTLEERENASRKGVVSTADKRAIWLPLALPSQILPHSLPSPPPVLLPGK